MIHFTAADDTSLKSLVVDREKVDVRICLLCREPQQTDGWDKDLLDRVVAQGLDVLNDSQLDWLFDNPVALLMLHQEVLGSGGSYWKDGV